MRVNQSINFIEFLNLYLFSIYIPFSFYSQNFSEIEVLSFVIVAAILLFINISIYIFYLLIPRKYVNGTSLVFCIFWLIFFSYHPIFNYMINIIHIRHYMFIIVLITLFLLFYIIFLRCRLHTITQFHKIFLVISCSLFILCIGNIAYRVFKYEIDHVTDNFNTLEQHTLINLHSQPDIYYIILDAYTSDKVLSEYFDLPNSELHKYLLDKGFYIAGNSKSNYNWTHISLLSILNLNYVDKIFGKNIHEYFGFKDFISSIHNSRLFVDIKNLDYRIYEVLSTSRLYPAITPANIEKIFLYNSSNEYYAALYGLTPLRYLYKISNNILPSEFLLYQSLPNDKKVDGTLWVPESVEWATHNILELAANQNERKFIFAHILNPHYPFYYDQNCELVEDYLSTPDYWLYYNGEFSIYKYAYRNQVKCLNKQIISFLDVLLENPKDKIVIIQGDHGPRIGSSTLEGIDLNINPDNVQFNVLNAFYFPNTMKPDNFNESMSLVNTFRQ